MKRYMLGGMVIGAVLACVGACWVVSATPGALDTESGRGDIACATVVGMYLGLCVGWFVGGNEIGKP